MSPSGPDRDAVVAVVGPTASGKTQAALLLARRLGGEILSADMGAMYRDLNAGTAKPPGRLEKGIYRVEGIPYHCVDVLSPAQDSDAGRFAELARPLLRGILASGRRPIVAGGTGLYIRALLEGLDEMPRRDPEFRRRLGRRAETDGRASLHQELAAKDPAAARRIPEGNLQRVIRALEVLELTGRPISEWWSRGTERRGVPDFAVRYVGLQWENAQMERRIRQRAIKMFPAMIREVAALVPSRFTGREPGFRCLGYRQALACARGEIAQAQGLESMIGATRAYAKRQRTWLRRQVPVRWIPAAGLEEEPEALAERLLKELE